MNGYNFKKLVSAFLLIATITGSGAFLFSQFFLTLSSSEDTQSAEDGLLRENAFVEPVPEFPLAIPDNSVQELSDADLPPVPETDNLTEQFAAELAREFLRSNPRGPQAGSEGERILTSPGDAVIEDIILKGMNAHARAELKHPSVPPDPKRIIRDPSPDDLAVYLARVDRLVRENFVTPRLIPSLATSPSSENTLNAARTAVEATLIELQDADVPESLLGLHTNLLKLLSYQNEDVSRAMGNDPLRAYYAFASRDTTYTNTLQAVMREAEKAKKIFDDATARAPMPRAPLMGLFSVPTAHAIGGVGDIVFDPAAMAQSLEEFFLWLKDMLLQILIQQVKTQIIQRMVAQIVNWIQGGGKPQFVSDWKGFLEDSKQNVIGGVIQQVAPGLCSPFRGFVSGALKPIPQQRLLEPPVTCTLDQVVSNIKGFAKDFSQGGWAGYFAVLQPKNNPWGAVLLTQQLALRAASKEEESKTNEGISGGGFLSTKTCVSPQTVPVRGTSQADSNCDPSQQSCAGTAGPTESELKSIPDYVPGSARCSGGACTSYQICAPNGWQVTTPGNTVANVTNQAITSPIPNIIGAEDIGAIISALIDSALNKLLFSQDAGLAGISTKHRRTPSQPDPEGDFFTEAFAVINNKEAALSFYIQILENGELSQETFNEAIVACQSAIQLATSVDNQDRVKTLGDRMQVAGKRLEELTELIAPIPALRDALDAQINAAREFLDTVEKERGTDESLNYIEKVSEFEALFGTAEASRKELNAVQDLYIRVQTKNNQAKKSLDVCTPGEE